MSADCTCDQTEEQGYHDCKVHVACDENCRALNEPETIEELRAALDHWIGHSHLAGCSHAC